jgi:transcriptional regulator
MYIPPYFAQTDRQKLQDFIDLYSFGLVVSLVEGELFASHLPLLLDRESGPNGALIGHMARQNPQWRESAGQQVLAVFSGPHVYVSPSWYEAEHVVPTWNYVAVHAIGIFRAIEDELALNDIVQKMTARYEAARPTPWSLAGRDDFVGKMLGQIVGFRIEIDKIEGKWKLNQNHPVERREKVIRVLQEREDENSQAIARLMQGTLSQRKADANKRN